MGNANTGKNSEVIYKGGRAKGESLAIVAAIVVPFAVLCFGIYTISIFAAYGKAIICPALSVMWVFGSAAALLLPDDRKKMIDYTMGMCAMYCLALLVLRMALNVVSGASAEMIAASYNQPIPLATGNTLPGVVQNFMSIGTLFIPGGFLIYIVKYVVSNFRSRNMQKMYDTVTGIRNDGRNRMV
jgi:hypothetical protein